MQRDVLPMPDQPHDGLVTYDAKDPATPRSRRSSRCGRRRVPRTCWSSCSTTRASARSSAFGGPCATPVAERLADERAEVQPLPHDGAVLAHAPGAADGAQPPLRRHGRDHRDRHVGAGLQLGPPEHGGAAGGDAQAQRLLHRAVRQVPRGAGLGDEPAGPVRRLARRRRRLRALLRLHRRRDQPVRAGAVRRHRPDRAGPHPGGGLPPHRGHDRPRDRLGPPAEGADARQAVLRLLRARAPRTRRTTCRSSGRTSTRAASTRAGTRCARRPSRGSRSSA